MTNPLGAARQGLSEVLEPALQPMRQLRAKREFKWVFIAVVLALVIIYPQFDNSVHINVAFTAEVYVLLALGLNVVIGYAGLLDLGYAAFFAIGAYTIADLGSSFFAPAHKFSIPLLHFGPTGIHLNFWLLIPIAALTAALCGVLFGAPTLRLRGDYLAIVTLGFGEIVPLVIRNLGQNNSLGLPNLTNGVNRITGIDSPPNIHIASTHISFQGLDPRPWYYLGLIIVVFSIIVIYSLRQSRLGRAWAAIREDEIAAAHMGINITRTRLMAFGLGAAFSGFAGMIYASYVGSVEASSFDFSISVMILLMVILGGMGSIPGVIIGAILLKYLDLLWLDDINSGLKSFGHAIHTGPGPVGPIGNFLFQLNLGSARPLIFGAILLIMMLLRPQGLWPSSTRARELHPDTEDISEEENVELYTARTE
ncbi:MAG: branched-chain amino acid ABC transporter permease [Chloroflexota bacterium]